MKRHGRYFAPLASPFALALLAAPLAHAAERPSINAYSTAQTAAQAGSSAPSQSQKLQRAASSALVTSVDEKRGVPTFLWASKALQVAPPLTVGVSAEQAALFHVSQIASRYNLSAPALATAKVTLVHDTGRGGILVGLGQEVDGVELFQTRMRVLMTRAHELVAVAGNLHASAAPGAMKGRPFARPAEQAVADAIADLYGLPGDRSSIVDTKTTKAGYRYFALAQTPAVQSKGVSFTRPARVKKVLFPLPDRLVQAYYVEIQAAMKGAGLSDGYAYVIAANDGAVLYRESLTQSESFDYRVWADDSASHRPLDGPQVDFTPHPAGAPDGSEPGYALPSLVSMGAFNKNPHGQADPWLAPGAIQSLGNNVDAYADRNAPDGYSNGDLRAIVTAPGVFDRAYDVTLEPLANDDQGMAATTQLFYVNNWLHDWWYDSGFNEAAGNAQHNNFARGGVGGDRLHVEAQDYGGTNNANMNTPADGESPRMQMYTWSGKQTRTLGVQPLNVNLQTGTAAFGAKNFNVTAEAQVVDDGVDPVTNGCEPLQGTSVAGKIAIVDRGGENCTFKLKTFNAETAGAIGIVLVNNKPGEGVIGMSDGAPELPATIPVLMISFEDGASIKAALETGLVTISMFREVQVSRDGTIDNGIIAHEWGHYFHHRLVTCGGVVCGGMSEGWGDFTALQMVVREGDDLDGTFATGSYASADTDSAYFGIRRAAYTTSLAKNPFTFKHMTTGEALPVGPPLASTSSNNAEVHNTGEVWSMMLFEGLVSLLKKSVGPGATYSFDEARRAMSDYVVSGMMLTPPNPTYTEQRDGILAAALAQNKDDAFLLANAFAKRGAGSCADSPGRFSTDNSGVVESFEIKPRLAIGEVTLDDSVKSCDADGSLDAEETGKVTVDVRNIGILPITGTEIEISSTTGGVVFPSGAKVTIDAIEPFSSGTATIDLGLDESVAVMGDLDLIVTVTNGATCETTVVNKSARRSNFDNVANASTTETFESDIVAWELTGDAPDAVWERSMGGAPGNHLFHAFDSAAQTDTALQSPPLEVSTTDDFVLSFKHAYKFETTPDDPATPENETIYWDGAVIEVSTDAGKSWQDISVYGDPGYGGTITEEDAFNALVNRPCYVNKNASYPLQNGVSINMGKALAGETALIRFRIGTDAGGGDQGWTIDEVTVDGVTNKPFPVIADDGSTCQHAPIASAGPDQDAKSGSLVTLDASDSSDQDGDTLTFAWAQTAGPSLKLTDETSAKPTFTAPALDKDTTLTFELTVSDGKTSAKDSVDIHVSAGPTDPSDAGADAGAQPPKPTDSDDGCGCKVAGDPSTTGAGGASLASLVALGLMLRRRRR